MGVAEFTILDPRMRRLILPGAHLERLHQGSRWAEGPVYFPAGDYLMWSDIPNARVWQWVPELGARIWSHSSNNCNGNTRDAQGRRVTCEHLTRSVVRFEPDGSRTVLADAFEGRRLNSPNDVIVASDGAVWFTDPTYGILTDYEGKRSTPEQPGCFVYRIAPETGAVEAKIRSMGKPNGLAFSLDETTLYVADSARSHDDAGQHHVMAFPVAADGTVGEGAVFAEIADGVPDGLRLDEYGDLWVSSARGVEIFAPDGTPLGHLHVPETVANLTFGGPKNNRLFITASTSVYAVFTAVRGAERPTRP
ncbi:SMP-30/gluconolactonase/LRE family protein [Siculibacillus lacustris]|uniref:SMP-30/gluconolactonase/LRE family protein n=1 Tax=Siculibacillus lacustris TaxID=1549641 RepID=A0A4Q9VWW4_9HYPH|nr:SMP-30/gluconolactonase/LRE family protein [Siculibacillus lacustris]TBW40863.1 SMP-30/gluconolactonase/LRE family protein [Siculibacillus lacustris]